MRRHSFLAGVQDYPGTGGLTPLKRAHADVDRLSRIAKEPKYMGPDPHVAVIKSPTLDEVKKELRLFLREIKRGDVAIFYFSGHGMRNDDGDLFLCFTDTDEADLELTALNISQLSDVLKAKRLNRVLVVLDCCYSGAAGAQLTKDSLSSPINRAENAMPDGKGIYVLSASSATQTAKEGGENGVFTGHLIHGIESGEADDDGDGHITVHDLALYLQKKVPEDAPNQTPFLSSKATTGTFVVAENHAVLEATRREEAATRRDPAFQAVRRRMKDAFQAGFLSHKDLHDVLDWMDRHPDCPVESEDFRLLEKFGSEELSWPKFRDKWSSLHSKPAPRELREKPRPVPRPTPEPAFVDEDLKQRDPEPWRQVDPPWSHHGARPGTEDATQEPEQEVVPVGLPVVVRRFLGIFAGLFGGMFGFLLTAGLYQPIFQDYVLYYGERVAYYMAVYLVVGIPVSVWIGRKIATWKRLAPWGVSYFCFGAALTAWAPAAIVSSDGEERILSAALAGLSVTLFAVAIYRGYRGRKKRQGS